jgi:hypothetical protein
LRTDLLSLEDIDVAADPDPYFALPKLYGAPAYARAPRPVPDTERPPDPDDLPIAAVQTEEERAAVASLHASSSYRPGDGPLGDWDGQRPALARGGGTGGGERVGARRFSIRALTGRLGPRGR